MHGIDLSTAMVAQLRAKPGSDDIGVTIGDFATTRVEGTFGLAYLVYNTIENLGTQDAQVECFRNVAAHLTPGGSFVIEVEVPPLRRLPPGEKVRAFAREHGPPRVRRARRGHPAGCLAPLLDRGRPSLDVLDAVPLCLAVRARSHGPTRRDDAARAVGRLEEEPFTAESTKHVSVWAKDG